METTPLSPRRLERRLQNERCYASATRYAFHDCGTLTPRQCATVLANRWDVLVGPSRARKRSKFVVPRLLAGDDLAQVPFLLEVQQQLPTGLRLICAAWPDGVMAMTALPSMGPNPSVWWCGFAYDAAQDLPSLAQLTGKKEFTALGGVREGNKNAWR